MTDYYNKNIHSTSQLQLVSGVSENQSTNVTTFNNFNESVNNNDINGHKPLLLYLSPIVNINTEEYSLMNNNSNEVSFNPQDFLITNSLSGKLRPPRQSEFLLLLLENPKYSSYITWLNKNEGIFKIHKPERVATLWRKVKNRHTNGDMDYGTFARGIRFYYKSG